VVDEAHDGRAVEFDADAVAGGGDNVVGGWREESGGAADYSMQPVAGARVDQPEVCVDVCGAEGCAELRAAPGVTHRHFVRAVSRPRIDGGEARSSAFP